MSKIALYIAPFALESPFEAHRPLFGSSLSIHTNQELNNLVKELQNVWEKESELLHRRYL